MSVRDRAMAIDDQVADETVAEDFSMEERDEAEAAARSKIVLGAAKRVRGMKKKEVKKALKDRGIDVKVYSDEPSQRDRLEEVIRDADMEDLSQQVTEFLFHQRVAAMSKKELKKQLLKRNLSSDGKEDDQRKRLSKVLALETPNAGQKRDTTPELDAEQQLRAQKQQQSADALRAYIEQSKISDAQPPEEEFVTTEGAPRNKTHVSLLCDPSRSIFASPIMV